MLLAPTVQRCWWLHGHSRLWRVLRFGHLLGPLPTKPTPKQAPQWICLPLWCVCHDWWVTNNLYFTLFNLTCQGFFVFVFYTTAYQAYHIFYTCCCEACFRKCDNLTVTLTSQAHCSCGCSGPVSTLPSRITVTDSTEQLSTLTSLSPHLFLPPWPSPACQRKEEKWTW